jgi:hypothetical protein
MSEHLISQYIDDELDLDDKIGFVEIVHAEKRFKDETVALLRQEKRLREEAVHAVPDFRLPDFQLKERRSPWKLRRLRPLAAMAAGLAAAAFVLIALWPSPEIPLRPFRFVLYQPEAGSVELAGSFTGWNKIPLRHAAGSGYWEITLELPPGEHRFSYIVEGGRRLADPTVSGRERDDFGGENSILTVRL